MPQSIPFWTALNQKPNIVNPTTSAFKVSHRTQGNFCERGKKLIKIADKSKYGWQVVAEYESDELSLGSEDEKNSKKLGRQLVVNAGRKTKQTVSGEKTKRRNLVEALMIIHTL